MKTPQKLLIIGSSQGVYGGIEAFMIALANAANQWSEFEVSLCFKLVNKVTEPNEHLLIMSSNVCSSVYFVPKLSKKLMQLVLWADILHVQNMPPDIVFPAYFLKKKILLTIHNRKIMKKSLHNLLWSKSIQLADKRWFNSNFVWDTWEPLSKKNNSSFVPTVCRLPSKWCPPLDRKGFLFVGRWIENKGIEEILIAYRRLNLDTCAWPLTILGDGPIRLKILDLIKELELNDIILLGFVDEKQKDLMIATTKWLLAPANTQEDLGLTPIEARNVGVPSIVTRDGGLPEAGGPSALIAEPGNVNDLMRCMKLAVEMSEEEYNERSVLATKSLIDFLKPMEFYKYHYLN